MTLFEIIYYSPEFFTGMFIFLLVVLLFALAYFIDGVRKYGYWWDKEE